jgi:selenocysteine lyase/cysteine desulfurase
VTALALPPPEDASRRLERWRADTPGTAGRVHLNNAGSALPPQAVLDAVLGHLRREAEIGGYEAADEAAGRVEETYTHLARLLGAAPKNIALVENATVAVAQALSAFDFRPGDVLVTSHSDYTSNQLMYLALAERAGIEVLRAADLPEGGVDPDSLRGLAAHPRCRLVSLTWIPTNSGLIQDAEAVGEICAERGVPYLLDACQAVGQLSIDAGRLRCDFLAGTSRKFLRGPRGIGFLYVSDRLLAGRAYPLGVDMRGAHLVAPDRFELADGARRFENWEFSYALVLGLGEAARYSLEVGEEGGRRALALAAAARERLAALPGVRIMDPGRRRGAIVTAHVEGWHAADLVKRLRQEKINTSAGFAGGGPLNAPQMTAPSVLRLSPHYYNTEAEVETAVAALQGLLERSPRTISNSKAGE